MDQGHNVILLIFDTLRSDYLGCYGSDTETAAFDSLAEEGVVFENGFGTAPGTPVSHASLYTGQHPSEHGVTGQYILLPDDRPVVAEWFREAGYDTFGITGPSKMGSDWDYDRGFDELYEHYYDMPATTSWRNITKSLTDWRFGRYFLRQITKGGRDKTRFKFSMLRDRIAEGLSRPFFTVCNVATVHAPYDPPRPYKQESTPGFSRPQLFLTEFLMNNPGTIDDPDVRLERVMEQQRATGIGRYLADDDWLNEKEVELIRNWYGTTVEYLDDEFSRFLEFYRRELQDDTVLIVTADHGEQLGEHGLWGHSYYCYDETLKIPLVVAGPGVPEGERRTDLASHVDVFDTLCDLCGLEMPGTTSGHSLFGDAERDAVFMEYGERDEDEFAGTAHGRFVDRGQRRRFCAGRKAIRTHDYRYELASDGSQRLLSVPEETELVDPPRDVRKRLHDRLLEAVSAEFGAWPEGDPDEQDITNQVQENLRQLGYIE